MITANPTLGRYSVTTPSKFGLGGRAKHPWQLLTNTISFGIYEAETDQWGLVINWSRKDGSSFTRHSGFFFADNGLPFIGDLTQAQEWHGSLVPGSAFYGNPIQPTGGVLFNAVWRNAQAFVTESD